MTNSNLIWKNFDGNKKLFIKNRHMELSDDSLILLNPYMSKLTASLFNGLEIFPIQSTSNIFLNDAYSKTVLEHFSNIVIDGKIYVLDNLKTKIPNTKNIQIITNPFNQNNFLKTFEMVDIIYLDIENQNIFEIIKNYELILKKNGFLIFFYNFKTDTNEITKNQIRDILIKLKDTFELIQEINLSDFFKQSFMIMMIKRK